ncbi:hypothetical protein EAF04_007019 [Stromatinia cepivora]|nr:hypothetical protein EAF04_007019 [Stromatinia cepivora]
MFRERDRTSHLNALQKVVAVQRAEAGGAQKRTRAVRRTEKARKKYRRHYAQGNDIRDSEIHTHGKGRAESSSSQDAAEAGPSTPFTPSIINSSAGACIIAGQGEISEMDLRNYTDSNPSPTLPYAKTPPNSPQIENSFPPPCGNSKGSLNNQEAIFKVSEALSSLQKPREGHEEYQNSLKSTEKASANTTKPSTQPQSDNISGATSSTIKRLPITDLLNKTRPDEHAKPPQLTTMMTTSSGLPVTDTGLGKLQGEMPVGL